LLLGQRLRDNRPNLFVVQSAHRLIILATFSKVRFPEPRPPNAPLYLAG
jgi:hypothetical protein